MKGPELFAAALSQKGRGAQHDSERPLVSLSDISEIELVLLRRLQEVTMGDHRSRAHGTGFDFVGLRDWQAGDRPSQVDWAQSTLNNFSPLVVREFEPASTAFPLPPRSRGPSPRSACPRCSSRTCSAC